MRKIYVFYADVFLLQNFLMDFVAVSGVNIFLKRHRRGRRLLAVTFLTSAVGLVSLLLMRNIMAYRLFTHFILNTIMVFLCFGRCDRREFLENWAVTYLVVIVLGGMLQWLQEGMAIPHHFLLQVLLAVFAGYGILLYLMQRRTFANHIYLVRLRKDERFMEVKAYWDSGNQLQDPYTGQGVSILSREKARCFLDAQKDRIRYVPYQSLGEKDGLLCVTNVDELVVFDGNKTMHMEHMAIGIADDGLLEKKEYDLILHGSLL